MFVDLLLKLGTLLVLLTLPEMPFSEALKIDIPIEPEQARFIRNDDPFQKQDRNMGPIYGYRSSRDLTGVYSTLEDVVSVHGLSQYGRRDWCPSSYLIAPCICEGPKQFTLFTCDKVSSENALQRIFQTTYFPVQELGKFTMINSEVETLSKGDLGTVSFEYIFMKKNTLKTIEAGALDASKDRVKRIEIVHNDLEKFPFKNISEFSKLEYLDLYYNSIKSIPDFCFGYHPKLKSIDLSFNKIAYVDSYAFDRLPELKSLNLSYNKLTVLNNYAFASNVANSKLKVDLSHNQMLLISEGAFEKRSLEVLDLSHNNLKSFSENIFGKMVNDMVNKKGVIVLNDNRFLCTCKNIGWLVRKPESYKRSLVDFFCTDLDKYLEQLTPSDVGCPRSWRRQ